MNVLLDAIIICVRMTSVNKNALIKNVYGITTTDKIQLRRIHFISMWTEVQSKIALRDKVLWLTLTEV